LADDLAHPRRVGTFVVARAHLDETVRDSSLLAAPSAGCA